MENKKISNCKKSPQQLHKNSKLTQTFKAKKPTKASSGRTATKLVSLMLNPASDNNIADMLVQTHRDFSNTNQFEEFVTSTKVKNSTQVLEDVKGVSPIDPLTIRSSTSAKRNILKETTRCQTGSQVAVAADKKMKEAHTTHGWKYNNWRDSNEAQPKASKPKNLSKIKKKTTAKANPNSALQQKAEMPNKKANNMSATTEDVVLTRSKVRDRKYFSPAAIVVGIPTSSPNRRLSMDSQKHRMSVESGGSGNAGRKSIESPTTPAHTNCEKPPSIMTRRAIHNIEAQTAFSPPKTQSRKSILKAPGSASTNLRNVVFHQKCRVKKFNDDADEPEVNDSIEEDMKQNPRGK